MSQIILVDYRMPFAPVDLRQGVAKLIAKKIIKWWPFNRK